MTKTNQSLTADTITDDQIRTLADECFARNDGELRMLCTIALEGLDGATVGDREYTTAEARQACADAINSARAQTEHAPNCPIAHDGPCHWWSRK